MTSSEPVDLTVQRLARLAPGASDAPSATIPWSTLDSCRPWMPESLISLHGLKQYAALSLHDRARLAQAEFMALVELGLWLEAHMIAALGRAAPTTLAADPLRYAAELTELREEAGHSLMFLHLRQHAETVMELPSPPLILRVAARFVRPHGLVFWASVLIGETVAAELNRRIAADSALPAAVRAIAARHHADEARHVAYARQRLEACLRCASSMRRNAAARVIKLLLPQFKTMVFFPRPAIYRAAALARPEEMAQAVRESAPRAALAAQVMAPALRLLVKRGLA